MSLDNCSDDQLADNRALSEAVERCALASGHEGIISHYVVIAEVTDCDSHGMKRTTAILTPPDGVPWTVLFGLIETGQMRARAEYMEPGD